MGESILIASASSDEHAYGPVQKLLETAGYSVIVYKTDSVMEGKERLNIEVTEAGELQIEYEGQPLVTEQIAAGWYRKVGNFAIQGAEQDVAKQLYINNEVRYLHDTIWPLLPEDLWLNAPDNIAHADRRLFQLMVARQVGFTIPQTIVSNDWDTIGSKLLAHQPEFVVKMMRGIIAENNQFKGLYTTVIDKQIFDSLKQYTQPFPGMYQPYLQKEREWRITVVGDEVFSAAIYTDPEAKNDWRKYQLTTSVRFAKEIPVEGTEEKCIDYINRMGLRFGAFDFVETPDGNMVFLECNPNGQYGWLEDNLGLPISKAITFTLIQLAKR